MDTCLWNGKQIHSAKLKDECNQYNKELLALWKRASEKKELLCEECKEALILFAGPKKEPYFGHRRGNFCNKKFIQESEESKRGKRLLYLLMERSLPDCDVRSNYQLTNGQYCTVHADTGKEIAIDFHHSRLMNIEYDARTNFYKSNNINYIYVFSGTMNHSIRSVSQAYQDTVQDIQGFCVFLHMYPDKTMIEVTYTVHDLRDINGEYINVSQKDNIQNFIINNQGELCLIINDEKIPVVTVIEELKNKKISQRKKEIENQEKIEKLFRDKLLRKEKERKEKLEKEYLERERIRNEEEQYEKFKKEQIIREQDAEQRRIQQEKIDQAQAEQLRKVPVVRYKEEGEKKERYHVSALGEWWKLPVLFRNGYKVCKCNPDPRNQYLELANHFLFIVDKLASQQLLKVVENRINSVRDVEEWRSRPFTKDYDFIRPCHSCKDGDKFVCQYKRSDNEIDMCKRIKTRCLVSKGTCTKVNQVCKDCTYK